MQYIYIIKIIKYKKYILILKLIKDKKNILIVNRIDKKIKRNKNFIIRINIKNSM